jgi:hypothetical protein
MAGKEPTQKHDLVRPHLRYLAVRLYNRDGKGCDVTALIDRLTGITAR